MGVTCALPHFVEDELYSPVGEMEISSTKEWDLIVLEINSSDDDAAVAMDAMATARKNSKAFVLDLDLDYFSTWNPFRKGLMTQIDDEAVETVTQVFSLVRYKRSPLELMLPEQRLFEKTAFGLLIKRLEAADELEDASNRTSEYNQVVNDLARLYAHDVNGARLLDDFIKVLERYREDKGARREIWTAGALLDLPHHESSLEEIKVMITELEQFLQMHALSAPAIVTIAKSTGDEFLPPHQEIVVLQSVLDMLEKVFGNLSIKYVEY